MGIFSASCSLSRYRVRGEVAKGLWPLVPDMLLNFAFQEIENSNEERSYGWVSIEDMLDNAWIHSSPYKGEYLAFALRLDTRKIPPAVFKKHYRLGLEEALEKNKEQGRNFVSRSQKQELKERIRSRLLSKVLPVPAIFDVVWDFTHNRVYFASIHQRMRNLFEDLFFQTFDLHLEPLNAYYLARQILDEEGRNNLEEYTPMVLV